MNNGAGGRPWLAKDDPKVPDRDRILHDSVEAQAADFDAVEAVFRRAEAAGTTGTQQGKEALADALVQMRARGMPAAQADRIAEDLDLLDVPVDRETPP